MNAESRELIHSFCEFKPFIVLLTKHYRHTHTNVQNIKIFMILNSSPFRKICISIVSMPGLGTPPLSHWATLSLLLEVKVGIRVRIMVSGMD